MMSFNKYLEIKSRPQISIVFDAYKEKLHADLSGLVLKPNQQLIEAKKNIIDILEVSKILSALQYPLKNEFIIAVRTGDPKKVHHAHMSFRKWTEYNHANKNSDQIEKILFQYEASLFDKQFSSEQADEVIKTSLAESKSILENLARQVDLAIDSMKSWGNHKVTIEAVIPENGWIISEATVIIGDSFTAKFALSPTLLGLKIGDLKKEDSIPSSLENDVLALMSKLTSNPKYNKILTLYMTRPITERRYFEMTKRDLSLGIKTVLPNHILLATMPTIPAKETDIWKVRIEEKYLQEHLCEGDYKEYYIIGDDAPIKWLDQFQKS